MAWSRALVFPSKLKPADAVVTWSPAAFELARKHKWLGPLVRDQPTVTYLAVTEAWEQRARRNEWHSLCCKVGTGLSAEYASFVFFMWCCFPNTALVFLLPWFAMCMAWGTLVLLAGAQLLCGPQGSRRIFDCLACRFPTYIHAIYEARLDAALARAANERAARGNDAAA